MAELPKQSAQNSATQVDEAGDFLAQFLANPANFTPPPAPKAPAKAPAFVPAPSNLSSSFSLPSPSNFALPPTSSNSVGFNSFSLPVANPPPFAALPAEASPYSPPMTTDFSSTAEEDALSISDLISGLLEQAPLPPANFAPLPSPFDILPPISEPETKGKGKKAKVANPAKDLPQDKDQKRIEILRAKAAKLQTKFEQDEQIRQQKLAERQAALELKRQEAGENSRKQTKFQKEQEKQARQQQQQEAKQLKLEEKRREQLLKIQEEEQKRLMLLQEKAAQSRESLDEKQLHQQKKQAQLELKEQEKRLKLEVKDRETLAHLREKEQQKLLNANLTPEMKAQQKQLEAQRKIEQKQARQQQKDAQIEQKYQAADAKKSRKEQELLSQLGLLGIPEDQITPEQQAKIEALKAISSSGTGSKNLGIYAGGAIALLVVAFSLILAFVLVPAEVSLGDLKAPEKSIKYDFKSEAIDEIKKNLFTARNWDTKTQKKFELELLAGTNAGSANDIINSFISSIKEKEDYKPVQPADIALAQQIVPRGVGVGPRPLLFTKKDMDKDGSLYMVMVIPMNGNQGAANAMNKAVQIVNSPVVAGGSLIIMARVKLPS